MLPGQLNIKATNSSFKTLGWKKRSPGENHPPPSCHSPSKVLQKSKSLANSHCKTVPEGCLGPKAWTKCLTEQGNSDWSWIRQQPKLTQAIGAGGEMKPRFPEPQQDTFEEKILPELPGKCIQTPRSPRRSQGNTHKEQSKGNHGSQREGKQLPTSVDAARTIS